MLNRAPMTLCDEADDKAVAGLCAHCGGIALPESDYCDVECRLKAHEAAMAKRLADFEAKAEERFGGFTDRLDTQSEWLTTIDRRLSTFGDQLIALRDWVADRFRSLNPYVQLLGTRGRLIAELGHQAVDPAPEQAVPEQAVPEQAVPEQAPDGTYDQVMHDLRMQRYWDDMHRHVQQALLGHQTEFCNCIPSRASLLAGRAQGNRSCNHG